MNDYEKTRDILRDIERRRNRAATIGTIIALLIGIPIAIAVNAAEWAGKAYILKLIFDH